MKADEREAFREALLSGIEPSAELRERFARQIEALLDRRLSKWEVVRNVTLAAVFIPMAGVFAYLVYFVALAEDLPAPARWHMSLGFGGGSLVFLTTAIFIINELRTGRVAARRWQQLPVGVAFAYVLLLFIGTSMFGRRLYDQNSLLRTGIVLLFYWTLAVAFMLRLHLERQHERVMLEQKRTQLEIALLREEMSRKIDQPEQGG